MIISKEVIKAVDKRARLVKGDLRNADDIYRVVVEENPDAVIHFAAYIEVGESMKNPKLFKENNVGGTINLINALKKSNCKKVIFHQHVRFTVHLKPFQ